MGGIKNKQEKMKKNHVYSSGGGGGGTKGPAIVDKRNQELQCPYCEKVFKQSERYKVHVAKHEADQAAAEAEGTATATADAASTSSASATARSDASTSGSGAAGAKPAAAARSSSAGGSDAGGSGSGSGTAGVMQVGSQAGYYSRKSPKLMLHEWVLSKKRPRTKYKVLPQEGGKFSCRVILPDPKPNGQDDLIVHLPREMAVDTEEEAEQLGALAAMSERQVMGGRMLHLVLPKQYVDAWQRLEERRAAREASQARAEERAAAEERRKRSQAAKGSKKPQVLVMSAAKQQYVQTVLQELRSTGGATPGAEGAGTSGADVAALTQQLQQLGFTDAQAQAACQACPSASAMEDALDWLLLHLPRQELPAKFRAGPTSKAVEIASSGNKAVQELVDCGYRAYDAMEALKRAAAAYPSTQQAAFRAHLDLFCDLTGIPLEVPDGDWDDEDVWALENTAWQEEMEVLEAIYGPDFQLLSASQIQLKLHLPEDVLEQLPQQASPSSPPSDDDDTTLLLTVTCLRTEPAYPDHIPLISLRCPRLGSAQLQHLTRHLARQARGGEADGESEGGGMLGMLGEPMIHGLATTALETLPETLQATATGLLLPRPGAPGREGQEGQAGLEPVPAAGGGLVREAQPRRRAPRQQQQDPARVAAENERLAAMLQQLRTQLQHAKMQETRKRLPAYGQREQVIQAVNGSQVVIISGATGCGKSTQVPQYILEDAIDRGQGGSANIIVTQPRRIAALGLASRVSDEMGQDVGQTVGYSVKSQSATSGRTRLLFCTTGIVLRRLLSDRQLEGVTHVVVDEVHERSVEVDMMLLLLRDLLLSGRKGLKVVLMSATADAQLFADYMAAAVGKSAGGVQLLTIPGFTHPVLEQYLEDILEATRYSVGKSSKYAKKSKDGGKEGSGSSSKRKLPEADSGNYSAATVASLEVLDEEQINYDLLEALICHIVERENAGGPMALLQGTPLAKSAPKTPQDITGVILVFLPGAGEISRLLRQLEGSPQLLNLVGGKQGLRVLPLHGALSASDQSRVFVTLPKGVRKIVLATNVAETSITIEGVTVVVDCGKARETKLDEERGIQSLQEQWVSQAEAQQRRGRAGRVRPGVCFRVFSRHTWHSMSPQQQPAILRTPLHALALMVRALFPKGGSLQQVLSRALTPPKPAALESAVRLLCDISALDAEEELNPLGQHLKQLPLDPQVGKMLVYAVMLGCLDHALTVAAAMGYGRPLFLNTQNTPNAAEVAAARQEVWAAATAARSDHLAIVLAFNAWLAARIKGGKRSSSQLCRDMMLSEQGMESVLTSRAEYATALADLGFVPRDYVRRVREAAQLPGSGSPHDCDANCSNTRLLKSAVCAGFYPHILRVQHPPAQYVKVEGGAFRGEGEAAKVKFFTAGGQRAFIHPGSTNFSVGQFESGWLVYSQMVRTSKVFVRESSAVPVYSMLLFGASDVRVNHEAHRLVLDGWAEFDASPTVAVLVKELRAEISRMLEHKIQNPGADLTSNKAVQAMIQLLSTDGF